MFIFLFSGENYLYEVIFYLSRPGGDRCVGEPHRSVLGATSDPLRSLTCD